MDAKQNGSCLCLPLPMGLHIGSTPTVPPNEMTPMCHGVERSAYAYKSRWKAKKETGRGKRKWKHGADVKKMITHSTGEGGGGGLHRSLLSWGRRRESDLPSASGCIRDMIPFFSPVNAGEQWQWAGWRRTKTRGEERGRTPAEKENSSSALSPTDSGLSGDKLSFLFQI